VTVLDDLELEVRARALFRQGKSKAASALQDEFRALVRAAGEDHCTRPAAGTFHGKCTECVTIHRGHGDHLPHCFRQMVNRRRVPNAVRLGRPCLDVGVDRAPEAVGRPPAPK
jgi:hypothetical protein